jgi:23S rRNA pseudouridine2605 synthase
MMHPRYEVEREYAVRILGVLTPEQEQALVTGIELEDGPGKVEKVTDGGGEGSNHWYHVVIKEGRNREVRRLFEALGLTVSRLIRTRYGTVAMPSRVKRGQTLELTPDEVSSVLVAAGMRSPGSAQGQGSRPRGQPHGKGPRPQRPEHRDRNESPQTNEAVAPPEVAAVDSEPDADVIEPGNSVHGLPTHHNTPVGKFFSKSHGKPHGRPQGHGGPRRGGPSLGGGGQPFQKHGRPQQGKPRQQDPRAGHRASPYVMTTLTVPGAVPEGLPGTEGQRPNRPRDKQAQHAQGRGNGPTGQNRGNGQGGGGRRRGRNRHRNGPRQDRQPGDETPRALVTVPPIVDDDTGNR